MNTLRKNEDSAEFGLTEYSDMTHAEFVAKKLSWSSTAGTMDPLQNSIVKERFDHRKTPIAQNIIRYARGAVWDVSSLPKKVDWYVKGTAGSKSNCSYFVFYRRVRGVISKVRNQGLCGACWAHSVIETVESMVAMGTNSSIIELSVQQMIDCAENNNMGCEGGDTCYLLAWLVHKNVSIQTMNEYPMDSDSSRCRMREMKNVSQSVQIDRFTCER